MLRCQKIARRCGAKHISRSTNMYKTQQPWSTFGICHAEKCTPLRREAHIEVKSVKDRRERITFGRSDVVVSHGKHKGFCTLPKLSKACGSCSKCNYNHHYTTLRSTTTTTTTATTLHCSTLLYITLHYATLQSITLH